MQEMICYGRWVQTIQDARRTLGEDGASNPEAATKSQGREAANQRTSKYRRRYLLQATDGVSVERDAKSLWHQQHRAPILSDVGKKRRFL